ncbi:MAG: hypothetical protein H6744_16585 [Deltaproteobacteria bacterium]|nr:hypothetical protein [Deltaproteobacteria bacterium]MCB9788298.1 hypothetical protein [Deltaproteobacteria bacterium]
MSHGHAPRTVAAEDVIIPSGHALAKLPLIAAVVGLIGIGASFALMGDHPEQFYLSWLTNFAFFLSFGLGGLWFVIVQHVTRAGWSIVVRRAAENLMVTLPVFALLFIPVIMGMEHLYHWVHPEEGDVVLQGKLGYLNTTFFLGRAAFYFIGWALFALFFYAKSVRQDESKAAQISRTLRGVAPVAIVFFALTLTFGAFDWFMSLDPHWFSTIFGVYYFAGTTVATFALLALSAMVLQRGGLLKGVVTTEHYHDLGKYLFAFNVFWTYIAFSQYFLIWYANIPEETMWYMYRMEGTWLYVSAFLALGHFVIPFFYLMSRHIKRNRKTLAIGALWMLMMHWVDMYWVIQPPLAHHHGGHGASLSVLDLTTFIGIGGIFLAVYAWRMRSKALVPVGDPRLAESLAFENL